jgi:ABC-type amino acid transport substrate-binding protein
MIKTPTSIKISAHPWLIRLLALTAVVAVVWLAANLARPALADESVLDQVKARGTLRAAGVVFPPLMIRRPNGEYYGADVELLGEFAQKLGVKLEFVNAGWDTIVAGITTDKWDLAPALCVTDKRKEVIDYSSTYILLGGVLTVLKDNKKINSMDDANKPDVVFADVSGGWGEQIAKKAFPNATHKVFGNATDDQIAEEVVSGRVDAAIFDTPITVTRLVDKLGDKFKFYPSRDKPIDVVPCPIAWGLKKGDTKWQAAVSKFIDDQKASGELQKLVDKYMTSKFITVH